MYTHGQIAGALFPSANAKSSLGCHMDERRDWRLPAPSRASFHIAAAGATYARWLGAASVKVSPTIGSKRSWIVPTTHFRMPSSTVTAVIRDGVPDADRNNSFNLQECSPCSEEVSCWICACVSRPSYRLPNPRHS
jgi:hypothetical protein